MTVDTWFINPRIGATFRLFVSQNGMDVARALYLDLTGQPVPPGTARDGRKWIVEDLDVASCFRYHQEGNLSMSEWFASLHGIEESAYFAADDLLPLGVMCVSNIRELGRRTFGRIRRMTLRPLSRAARPYSGLVQG